jgi:hypothetical protein
MTWLQRYRVRHYDANSFWILPVLGMVAAVGAVHLQRWIDAAADWQSGLDPDTTRRAGRHGVGDRAVAVEQ